MADHTRTFTRAELDDLGLPYEGFIDTWIVDERRWSLTKRGIFEHDGQHWMVTFSDPATEMQDADPWDWKDSVTATAVERRTVEVERWMPIREAA